MLGFPRRRPGRVRRRRSAAAGRQTVSLNRTEPRGVQQAKAQMGYSWTAILLHWSLAVLLIGLFALGLWMTSLDYYHPWYRRAPDLHRDLGLLAGLLVLWRLGLRLAGTHPSSLPGMRAGERRVSIS